MAAERGSGPPPEVAGEEKTAEAVEKHADTPSPPKVKVAVAQMCATGDVEQNFATCQQLVQEAKAAGAALLSLPECFSFIGAREGEALAVAQPLDGPLMRRYQALAREASLWLSLGGFQEKGPDESHLYNTHVLLDDSGAITKVYRKIHLFDVDVPGGPRLMESNGTAAGGEVVAAPSPAGALGLTICYDLRFPELYQQLRFSKGAELLLVPSAFTKKTGEAHWELLLRARAVECQCYVLAAAQAGKHNERRESFGDALIVDPWGTVVARCADPLVTGIAVAEIDPGLLQSVRQRMPVGQHRRYDIYGAQATDDGPSGVQQSAL